MYAASGCGGTPIATITAIQGQCVPVPSAAAAAEYGPLQNYDPTYCYALDFWSNSDCTDFDAAQNDDQVPHPGQCLSYNFPANGVTIDTYQGC